ncbi:3-deoxy-D-manno-octulosonic acid kinase [Halospina denitrificans]|uniref:3-deoxy-D-manno-octulosonic acid kinase n=1 Tax=Halospina denitrificans TaxID=332522 RepID=A0A4R7K2Q2_9GAMM|nr:3-deoxy-D-manno-octulosonic acid kinase [Halospina denitrificans]TDT44337.1 3-deoxy-D-manno-octulosonic acid kinase [Halospina denitrificans]
MTEPATSVGDGRAQALVAGAWDASFEWGWFEPEWWGQKARAVDDGGRGSAWFIDSQPPMVLRRYQRGGLMARLSRSTYLYLGRERTRSFSEFRLLEYMKALELPVPAPIAAAAWRTGPVGYQAAILVERLYGTRALGSIVGTLGNDAWRAVGRTIHDFHEAAICHADLNCFNILLSDEGVYLIDFDKGQLRGKGYGWRDRNLQRLHRSLEKLAWPESGISLEEAWAQLLQGYRSG